MKQQALTTGTQGIPTDLQEFQHEVFGQVRVVAIDGVTWFVGRDITRILAYKNGSRDINRHVDSEDRQNYRNGSFGKRGVTVINLSGLLSLVLACGLPQARPFQRWVTGEVLPSVLLHGAYITHDKLNELEADPAALGRLTVQLRSEVAVLTPKARLYTRLVEQPRVLSATRIALEYGMSARALNSALENYGIQHKQDGGWALSEQYANLGYTVSNRHKLRSGAETLRTMWTQTGRRFIRDEMVRHGIMPIAEDGFISTKEAV